MPRYCSKCGVSENDVPFKKNRKVCTTCYKKYQDAYNIKYRENNKESISDLNKQWIAEHREERLQYLKNYRTKNIEAAKKRDKLKHERKREEHKEYCSIYNATHKKQRNERAREKRRTDPEGERAKSRRARAKNPAPHQESNDRRRFAQSASVNDFSYDQWLELLDVFQYRCAYCDGDLTILTPTRDHLTAFKHGGAHTLHNIVPACRSCNSKKHSGPPLCPVQPLLLTLAPAKKTKRKS